VHRALAERRSGAAAGSGWSEEAVAGPHPELSEGSTPRPCCAGVDPSVVSLSRDEARFPTPPHPEQARSRRRHLIPSETPHPERDTSSRAQRGIYFARPRNPLAGSLTRFTLSG